MMNINQILVVLSGILEYIFIFFASNSKLYSLLYNTNQMCKTNK